jgi:short subunit dehydrogenase-like uncharacterized protein
MECPFLVAGRDEEKLSQLAGRLDCEYRVASLGSPDQLRAMLQDMDLLVHAAGPFHETTAPMLSACLDTNTHYLDLSAEAESIELVAARHRQAQAANIMCMPGVGVDVVPSDCLAAQLVERLPSTDRLSFGISLPKLLTAGSARNFAAHAGMPVLVRRGGKLKKLEPGIIERKFDYGEGPSVSSAISWGDIASAWYSTGVGNISCYLETTAGLRFAMAHASIVGPLLKNPWARFLTDTASDVMFTGPSEDQEENERGCVVVEAEDRCGRVAMSRIQFPESYSFTAKICAVTVDRIRKGRWASGFQTPSRVFGADYIRQFDDVVIEEIL